jgi:hypothetical protein
VAFFRSEHVSAVGKQIVSIEESMAMEVDQDNMEDLTQSHKRELITEDLKDLGSFTEKWNEITT